MPTNAPGTILPNGGQEQFFPSMPSPPSSLASSTANMTTPATPTQSPQIPPQSSVYLPPFPFNAHPEILHKSPFLPYGMRAIPSLPITSSTSSTPSQLQELQQMNNSRLSPASSRNSTSSPPSNKINSSIELNSTNDHSSHSSSDDSDDEHIDVVKSAFMPILRPSISATMTTTTTPDSTVKEQSPPREIPQKIRHELKAPSSKKLNLHEKAPECPRSPETKIKSPTITQKTVWRPY